MEQLEKLFKFTESLVNQEDFKRAATLLAQKHPGEVAEVLRRLDHEGRLSVFKYLPIELQADTIIRLEEEVVDEIIEALSVKDLSELVEEMDVEDAADFLADFKQEEQKEVLSLVPLEERQGVEEILQYEKDTAGDLMSKTFLTFPEKSLVQEVLSRIQLEAEETEHIFVVTEDGKLKGEVYLMDLIRAKGGEKLGPLTRGAFSVPGDMDQEEVVRLVKRYDLFAVAVVDSSERPVGVVNLDDLLEAVEEEASRDVFQISGLGEVSSLFASPFRAFKRRIPWLLFNLLTVSMAAFVVGLFKDTIASLIYLAVFMPVVAGVGGNAGTQTLAIAVRGLAQREIEFREVRRLLLRQIVIGIFLGGVVGLLTGGIAFFWVGNPFFGVLVFVALFGNVILACIVGLLIPILLRTFGQDPALGSGVLVTTVTDATGFALLLGLAALFLRSLQ